MKKASSGIVLRSVAWGLTLSLVTALTALTFYLPAASAPQDPEIPYAPGALKFQPSGPAKPPPQSSDLVYLGWDPGGGAAALATILRHYFQRRLSETDIVLALLKGSDPAEAHHRDGFSLRDLKRFAETQGLRAEGYGGMTLDELAALGRPLIVPVRIKGHDHFAVFRGTAEGNLLLGDPAVGNISLTPEQFRAVWKGGIGLLITAERAAPLRMRPLPPQTLGLAVKDLNLQSRVLLKNRSGA